MLCFRRKLKVLPWSPLAGLAPVPPLLPFPQLPHMPLPPGANSWLLKSIAPGYREAKKLYSFSRGLRKSSSLHMNFQTLPLWSCLGGSCRWVCSWRWGLCSTPHPEAGWSGHLLVCEGLGCPCFPWTCLCFPSWSWAAAGLSSVPCAPPSLLPCESDQLS